MARVRAPDAFVEDMESDRLFDGIGLERRTARRDSFGCDLVFFPRNSL
jgi:hypothetical protein